MKYWIMLLLLILLVGCAKTKIVRLDQGQIAIEVGQPSIIEEEQISNSQIEIQETSIQDNAASDDKLTNKDHEETISKINMESDNKSNTIDQTNINPSEEYIILNQSAGKVYAQTKKERNAYSVDDIKNILLEIYYDNCNLIKTSIIQRIYLRMKNDIQDSAYLTYYKIVEYKRILIDSKIINENFEVCS